MFKFCKIERTNLVCYPTGLILRFDKRSKKWKICKGTKHTDGYLMMRIDRKWYLMHRVLAHAFKILDLHSELKIDHKDRDRSNNNISNFRPGTSQENSFNTDAKGYSWHKGNKKWRARICLDGKSIHLGYFVKEEDARNAYLVGLTLGNWDCVSNARPAENPMKEPNVPRYNQHINQLCLRLKMTA